jgi:hypothetical protein
MDFITQDEFKKLVGHMILASIPLFSERKWLASPDRSVVGVIVFDTYDKDYGWVLFRKEHGIYVTSDVNASLPGVEEAIHELRTRWRQ